MGFGVKAFDRVEQLPVGAATHGIDLLIHGGIAADLPEKTDTALQVTACGERFSVENESLGAKFCLIFGQVWTRVIDGLGPILRGHFSHIVRCVSHTAQTKIFKLVM